jgi:hypothetical protein
MLDLEVQEVDMSFKTSDPNLILKKFTEKLEELGKYKLQIGIPKEFKRTEIKDKRREQRVEGIEMDRLMAKTKKAIKRGDNVLPQYKSTLGNKEEYIADIAFKNDFGSYSQGIPARPFGTTMPTRYKDKISKVVGKEIQEALTDKKSIEVAYNRIGLACQGFMQDNLKNGNWKPNSPTTIEIKGSSRPLIDKGQMRVAISFVLEDLTSYFHTGKL